MRMMSGSRKRGGGSCVHSDRVNAISIGAKGYLLNSRTTPSLGAKVDMLLTA